MRHAAVALFVVALCALGSPARAETVSFERDVAGIPPSDFDSWGTGEAGPGLWAVVIDETARGRHALEQYRREPTEDRFALAIYKPFSGADLEVEARFKLVAGAVDRSAGVALRLLTPDDYYVALASAEGQYVSVYRVLKGEWQELARAGARVLPQSWHALRVRAEGDRLSVSFDGQQLLALSEPTLKDPGRVAFWTRADSLVRFDQLEIRSLP